MKIEKELIKLAQLHQEIKKEVLIGNINRIIRGKKIYRKNKIRWVCDVTGSPSGTVYTWFTYARCRSDNKIPLYGSFNVYDDVREKLVVDDVFHAFDETVKRRAKRT